MGPRAPSTSQSRSLCPSLLVHFVLTQQFQKGTGTAHHTKRRTGIPSSSLTSKCRNDCLESLNECCDHTKGSVNARIRAADQLVRKGAWADQKELSRIRGKAAENEDTPAP